MLVTLNVWLVADLRPRTYQNGQKKIRSRNLILTTTPAINYTYC